MLKQEVGTSVGFELMHEQLIGRSHFSVGFGLGYTSFNYNNNLNIVTDPYSQQSQYQFLGADTTYGKNRQVLQYIEVPIELRYRSKVNRKGRYFRFYPFIKIGYLLKSYNHFEDGKYSVVHFNIQGLNRWRATVGLRTGIWIFNLYATYDLTSLYQPIEVEGVDLSEFRGASVGLSVSF